MPRDEHIDKRVEIAERAAALIDDKEFRGFFKNPPTGPTEASSLKEDIKKLGFVDEAELREVTSFMESGELQFGRGTRCLEDLKSGAYKGREDDFFKDLADATKVEKFVIVHDRPMSRDETEWVHRGIQDNPEMTKQVRSRLIDRVRLQQVEEQDASNLIRLQALEKVLVGLWPTTPEK